jgi:hypothetical protein
MRNVQDYILAIKWAEEHYDAFYLSSIYWNEAENAPERRSDLNIFLHDTNDMRLAEDYINPLLFQPYVPTKEQYTCSRCQSPYIRNTWHIDGMRCCIVCALHTLANLDSHNKSIAYWTGANVENQQILIDDNNWYYLAKFGEKCSVNGLRCRRGDALLVNGACIICMEDMDHFLRCQKSDAVIETINVFLVNDVLSLVSGYIFDSYLK